MRRYHHVVRAAVVLALLAAGCGRLAFEPRDDAGGDDGGTDAAADAAPADTSTDGPFVCGDLAQMADDFNDGTTDPAKWFPAAGPGTTVGEVSGLLRIGLAEALPNLHYGSLRSVCDYDLRGRSVAATAVGRPRSDPSAEMALCLIHLDAGYHQVCVDFNGSFIIAVFNDNGTAMSLASRAFNPTADLHWRLREQGGTTFFETSSNGLAWTPLHSLASPIDMSQARVLLLAGTYASVANPGTADFDDLVIQ